MTNPLAVNPGLRRRRCPSPMIGQSRVIQDLDRLIQAVGPRQSSVVIRGESGTGKELVARRIHAAGPRADRPFVPVDCTSLHGSLFESELFGHTRGAFTGADRSTTGFIRAADHGSLFLDEIGDLALPLQAKLLRCIQEQLVTPVGSVEPIPVDIRVIAATHQNLEKMVDRGEFRQDLYYRLHVVRIDVQPLRERKSDIPALARHFLQQVADPGEAVCPDLSPELIDALCAYHWPGNVRELANAIEHAYVVSCGEPLAVRHLPPAVQGAPRAALAARAAGVMTLSSAECNLIARALEAAGGQQNEAARLLGIDRHRLYRKIRQYGLEGLTRTRWPR